MAWESLLLFLLGKVGERTIDEVFDKMLQRDFAFKTTTGLIYFNSNDSVRARAEIAEELANRAQNSQNIKIMVATGETVFTDITSILHKVMEEKVTGSIKILLLDPKCTDFIRIRAEESRIGKERYKKEVEDAIQYCKNRKLISWKTYRQLPIFRIFIFDNPHTVFVQFYLPGKPGDESPIFGFDIASPYSLGGVFQWYFDSYFSEHNH